MKTRDEKILEIMGAERAHTLSEIQKLKLSDTAKEDVIAVSAAVQDAVNRAVASLGRSIDQRVVPAALYLIGDEIERINKRFRETGLSAPLQ